MFPFKDIFKNGRWNFSGSDEVYIPTDVKCPQCRELGASGSGPVYQCKFCKTMFERVYKIQKKGENAPSTAESPKPRYRYKCSIHMKGSDNVWTYSSIRDDNSIPPRDAYKELIEWFCNQEVNSVFEMPYGTNRHCFLKSEISSIDVSCEETYT